MMLAMIRARNRAVDALTQIDGVARSAMDRLGAITQLLRRGR